MTDPAATRGGEWVVALDCGTHAVRAIAFDVASGGHHECAQEDLPLSHPAPGFVEIDPDMLAEATIRVVRAAFAWARDAGASVVALGLTNMRETAFAWSRSSGRALHPGVMWLSAQSEPVVARWREAGYDSLIRERTGLTNHSFFFGSKVAWMLENVPAVRAAAADGDLAVGMVDAWLLHRLTAGATHATDTSNGSRAQLMDLRAVAWDPELCARLEIPPEALPALRPSQGAFGLTDAAVCGLEVPITGVIADQQASLFGHGCESAGDVKATFGTSGVVSLNCGTDAPLYDGLVTSVGWTATGGETSYQIEGSAFHSGYTISWLRERLVTPPNGVVAESPLAASERVYVLPSFSAMGAPRWPSGRGAVLSGLGMDTSVADIMRAGVEAMAFQAYDTLSFMSGVAAGSGEIVVDGGGAGSDYLCQLLADLAGRDVVRPTLREITSAGAAKTALLGAGRPCPRFFGQDRAAAARFAPRADSAYCREGYAHWVELLETVLQ